MSCQAKIEIIVSKVFNDHIKYNTYQLDDFTESPDSAFLKYLASQNLESLEKYIVHSTSWRYESGGYVLLTYLVVVPTEENIDLPNIEDVSKKLVAESYVSYIPTPVNLKFKNVLHHAFKHLSFLLQKENSNIYKHCIDKNQYSYILRCVPYPAGEINTII